MERTKNSGTVQVNIQTLSSLVQRTQLATRMGLQSYDGDRDINQALGYPKTIEFKDYLARYYRQDMAKAIIDRPVNATWQGGVSVIEMDTDKETELEKAWNVLEDELELSSRLARVDKLAGLSQWAIILFGLDDVSKPEDFATPVNGNTKKLEYVKCFAGEGSAKIVTLDTNTKSKRYGMPHMYSVEMQDEASGSSTSQIIQVHYTRVIHIVEDPLESDVSGTPRLEAVFNRLLDLEKVVGGDGEMFWRGARPGYTGTVDKDFQMDTTTEGDLKDQINEFEHNLRRILVNEGVELKALEQQISDPTPHVQVILQMISAVTAIPIRILTGSERGELASSQDSNEWKTYVQNRRDGYATPRIIRPVIKRLIELKVLPKPTTKKFTIKWSDLFAISEKEKVLIGVSRAAAIRDYVQNPISETIIPPEGFREFFLGFTQDQLDLINRMVEKDKNDENSLFNLIQSLPQMTPKVDANPAKTTKPAPQRTTKLKRTT